MTLVLGILRFGFLDNLISRPILHGFVSASGALILCGQLDAAFGMSVPEFEWKKIIGIYENYEQINLPSLYMSSSCIVAILIIGLSFLFPHSISSLQGGTPLFLFLAISFSIPSFPSFSLSLFLPFSFLFLLPSLILLSISSPSSLSFLPPPLSFSLLIIPSLASLILCSIEP